MSDSGKKDSLERNEINPDVCDRNIHFRKRDEDQMTASYSEIAFQSHSRNIEYPDSVNDNGTRLNDPSEQDCLPKPRKERTKYPERPISLMCDTAFPHNLDGTVRREGEMTHFVAENIEYKLKLSSPITKRDISPSCNVLSKNSTPSTSTGLLPRHFPQFQLAQIDSNVLSDIEIDAQYLAASVDNLTENLYNLLRSISSITADNVEIHKNSVNKLTDNMDANIKCMYTIMAKTEEISKSMKPTEQLAVRIREIKRLVDMLENNL